MRDVELIPGATPSLRRRIYAKMERHRSRRRCYQWFGAFARKRRNQHRPKIQVGGRGSRVVCVARLLLVLRDRVPLGKRRRKEAGHTCDNFWCVNVGHLLWQTRRQNERSKARKKSYDFGRIVS